jgi:hypothetical protein
MKKTSLSVSGHRWKRRTAPMLWGNERPFSLPLPISPLPLPSSFTFIPLS